MISDGENSTRAPVNLDSDQLDTSDHSTEFTTPEDKRPVLFKPPKLQQLLLFIRRTEKRDRDPSGYEHTLENWKDLLHSYK